MEKAALTEEEMARFLALSSTMTTRALDSDGYPTGPGHTIDADGYHEFFYDSQGVLTERVYPTAI